MLKVLKSGSVNVSSAGKTVAIPDAVIIKPDADSLVSPESLGVDLSAYSKEDIEILENYFQERRKQMMDSVNKEISRLEAEAAKILEDARNKAAETEAAALRQAAETEAAAQSQAESIINAANLRGNEIYSEAQTKGIKDGQQMMTDKISSCFAELDGIMKQLKQSQTEQFNEIYRQLKYLALDIAEKVVYRKIDENDHYLCELVMRALKELKDPEWIKVEISDKMSGLISYLKEQQKAGLIDQNTEFVSASSENGGIRLESQAGICDASIAEQLKNIRSYFDNCGDDENGLYSGNNKSEK